MKFMSKEVFYRTVNKMVRDGANVSSIYTSPGRASIIYLEDVDGTTIKLFLYYTLEEYDKADELPACE